MIQLPSQRINVAMNTGGLGDRLAQMPAVLYCLRENPHVTMDLWCPDYFVDLARHFLRCYEDRVDVIATDRANLLLDQTLPSVAFRNQYCTSLRMHLVDNAFVIMNGVDVEPKHKNYPKLRLDEIDTVKFNLEPNTYVCLTPAFTSTTRQLPSNTYNEIATWIRARGLEVVWLGAQQAAIHGGQAPKSKHPDDIDYSVGIDLRDRTTLLEAGKLLALASCVLGLDSGLQHLAACSDVNIIVAYSMVAPEIRLPYRHGTLGWNCYVVEPEESLACRYCQSSFHFLYQHDFRACYTGTLDCVKQLTSTKFITQLEKALCQ